MSGERTYLHNHPVMEKMLGVDKDHVIVDRDAWAHALDEHIGTAEPSKEKVSNDIKYKYAMEKLYPNPATEEQLNIMGNDGWELTGCMTIQEFERIGETYLYYFKKAI